MTIRCLSDRSWMAEARRSIREDLLGPLDGKATQRFAETVAAAVEMEIDQSSLAGIEDQGGDARG